MSQADTFAEPSSGGQSDGQRDRIPTAASLTAAASRPSRRILPGIVLVLAVLSAGSPRLEAPWLQGDEHLFIVNESDVTGVGRDEPFARRWLGIFSRVHGDLYQPLPMAMYALEWRLADGNAALTRVIDVLLHAVNGLLVWAVLYALLRRLSTWDRPGLGLLTWGLALLWSVHPVQVTSFAADMCRTHLLAALFSMVALLLYLRALATRRLEWAWFTAGVVALLLAMLCKAVAGWFLLAIGLELAVNGLRPSLRRASFYVRVGIVSVICAVFATLTLWTSVESGQLEGTSQSALGGPLERSLLAVWLYARNLAAPFWISPWYPPDPRTDWGNPAVWLGALIALASVVLAARAARRPNAQCAALGIVWVWALLLPVIGVVAARVSAANDRYLYQPLIGILLVAAATVCRSGLQTMWNGVKSRATRGEDTDRSRVRIRSRSGDRSYSSVSRPRSLAALVLVLAAAMVLWDRALCEVTRSTIARAQRAVDLDPGNPRALEGLGHAYDFATTRPTPEGQAADPPNFTRAAVSTFVKAASQGVQHPEHFAGQRDRAAFHRRIAFRLLQLAAAPASLEQARIASDLEPEAPASWVCVARAQRALRQWDEAVRAYERLETVLPADASNRALLLTEFGMLLEDPLGRIDDARRRYQAALRADPVFVPPAIGLARLEVRHGQGETGYAAIVEVLRREPRNIDALLVAGEYHLRSHHWEQAREAYIAILALVPVHYDALRGFHEVCMQTDRWSEAIAGWDHAAGNAQGQATQLVFRSFQVWASACGGEPRALEASRSLVRVDPDNRFACLTAMLFALREGQVEQAVEWAGRSSRGVPLPQANEQQRAVAALRLLREKGQLLSESTIAEAVLLREMGQMEQARELLTSYREAHGDSQWLDLVGNLLDGIPQPDAP